MQNVLTLETNKYAIKIENFEGPLDLLCHLIDKNKMNIYEINLSEITDQYIEYINAMEKMNLENLIEQQGLSKQVVFCGRVTDQTLADLYQLADIFVMPNRDLGNDIEGFGAVFLEAASFGLPIIAGKNGGVMEILTDKVNALLVDSDDSQALFGALSKLLSDDKLAKALATAALSRSRDFVSYRVQSDKLAKILT